MVIKKMMMENAVVKNFKRNGYKIISFDNEYNLEPSENSNRVCSSNVRSIALLIFFLENGNMNRYEKA